MSEYSFAPIDVHAAPPASPAVAGEEAGRQQLQAQTDEYFRFARVDRRTRKFQPAHKSYDAAIYESHDLLTRRVRDQVANNGIFKRAVEVLNDITVGPGMLTFADPFPAKLNFDEKEIRPLLEYALESDDLFEEWAEDPDQFDVAGKQSLYDVHRLAFSECGTVGDALLLRCYRPGRDRITPLCYQVIEREQLDTGMDRPATAGQNKIVNGIELDSVGRPVAYHIFDAHPYDQHTASSGTFLSRPVPAARVLHLYLFNRPSQSCGISWLHAMAQSAFDRDKYLDCELRAAAKGALLAVVANLKNPERATLGLSDDDDAADGYGNPEVVLGSDPLAVQLHEDEKVEVVESNRPNANAAPFISMIDHDLACASGLSYYRLTGRYESTSYTAVRGAHLDDDAHIKPLQGWFGRRLAVPIRREFNRGVAAAGLLRTVTPAEFERNYRQLQRFDAVGAGRDLLDPTAELDASVGKLRAGLSTLKDECGKRQRHWIRILRQKALENQVAGSFGVVLDFSKGQGGQVEKTTSSNAQRDAKDKQSQKEDA